MISNIFIHPFKNRTVTYYIGLGAAALSVVGAIAYAAADFGDKSFSTAAVVLMLLGGISFAVVMFTGFAFAPIIPTALYILGFALALNATLPPLSDVWNGVNFIGGDAFTGLTFTIIFAVCAVIAIAVCFTDQGRKADK